MSSQRRNGRERERERESCNSNATAIESKARERAGKTTQNETFFQRRGNKLLENYSLGIDVWLRRCLLSSFLPFPANDGARRRVTVHAKGRSKVGGHIYPRWIPKNSVTSPCIQLKLYTAENCTRVKGGCTCAQPLLTLHLVRFSPR